MKFRALEFGPREFFIVLELGGSTHQTKTRANLPPKRRARAGNDFTKGSVVLFDRPLSAAGEKLILLLAAQDLFGLVAAARQIVNKDAAEEHH